MQAEKDELPVPAQAQSFFCNKCGAYGDGPGWPHKRRDGSECDYMASTTGPFFTADQMHAHATSKLAELLSQRENLAAMMRLLISSLKRHHPDATLPARATVLLREYGLMGSPLRDAAIDRSLSGGEGGGN